MGIQFPTPHTVVVCRECNLSWDAHLRLSRSDQVNEYYRQLEAYRDGDIPTEPAEIAYELAPPQPTFRHCVQLLKEERRGPTGPQGPMGPMGMPAPKS